MLNRFVSPACARGVMGLRWGEEILQLRSLASSAVHAQNLGTRPPPPPPPGRPKLVSQSKEMSREEVRELLESVASKMQKNDVYNPKKECDLALSCTSQWAEGVHLRWADAATFSWILCSTKHTKGMEKFMEMALKIPKTNLSPTDAENMVYVSQYLSSMGFVQGAQNLLEVALLVPDLPIDTLNMGFEVFSVCLLSSRDADSFSWLAGSVDGPFLQRLDGVSLIKFLASGMEVCKTQSGALLVKIAQVVKEEALLSLEPALFARLVENLFFRHREISKILKPKIVKCLTQMDADSMSLLTLLELSGRIGRCGWWDSDLPSDPPVDFFDSILRRFGAEPSENLSPSAGFGLHHLAAVAEAVWMAKPQPGQTVHREVARRIANLVETEFFDDIVARGVNATYAKYNPDLSCTALCRMIGKIKFFDRAILEAVKQALMSNETYLAPSKREKLDRDDVSTFFSTFHVMRTANALRWYDKELYESAARQTKFQIEKSGLLSSDKNYALLCFSVWSIAFAGVVDQDLLDLVLAEMQDTEKLKSFIQGASKERRLGQTSGMLLWSVAQGDMESDERRAGVEKVFDLLVKEGWNEGFSMNDISLLLGKGGEVSHWGRPSSDIVTPEVRDAVNMMADDVEFSKEEGGFSVDVAFPGKEGLLVVPFMSAFRRTEDGVRCRPDGSKLLAMRELRKLGWKLAFATDRKLQNVVKGPSPKTWLKERLDGEGAEMLQ